MKIKFVFAEEPSKPTNVELTDWDKDHADLKWTKPTNDGGAPITGYVIEYKVIYLFGIIIFYQFVYCINVKPF